MKRRDFLKSSGFIIASFSLSGLAEPTAAEAQATGPYLTTGPDPRELDSFIAIAQDGTVTLFLGKTDNGQGTGTALRQMMADELDVAYEKTRVVMGDSLRTVDQGGMSFSTSVVMAGAAVRNASAEGRRVLIEMASKKLAVPADQLSANNSVISVKADPSRNISYGELIGGQRFNTKLTWNEMYGNNLAVSGVAKPKPVQHLKVIGKPIGRDEIPLMATGKYTYNVDVKVPGMVHGRSVKPPIPGSKLMSVDESSVRSLPGFIQVVTKGNYVGVVCQREEQAIQAAKQLKVNWQVPSTPNFPGSDNIYDYIRMPPAWSTRKTKPEMLMLLSRPPQRCLRQLTNFRSIPMLSFSPACAVVDPTNNQLTIWSGTQKIYDTRRGIAQFLGMPVEKVHAIWVPGPDLMDETRPATWATKPPYSQRQLIGRFDCSGPGPMQQVGIRKLPPASFK